MINQACDDMVQAYATLAETAESALDAMNSTIGRMTEWRYEAQAPGMASAILYRETPMSWIERALWLGASLTEEEVPHRRADEARARVTELFDAAAADRAEFDLHIESIAETPRNIGQMLAEWLTIRDEFTQLVAEAIPMTLETIRTDGNLAGWSSPTAAAAYENVVSFQDNAAGITVDVVTGLLDNGPYPRILDTVVDYAAVGSVAARRAS